MLTNNKSDKGYIPTNNSNYKRNINISNEYYKGYKYH